MINDFFGNGVKVAGLIRKGIIEQLKGKDIGSDIFIPECMLKRERQSCLTMVSVDQLEKELGAKIAICREDGVTCYENISCLI